MDKKTHYNYCLDLFRNCRYTEALVAFREYEVRQDLEDVDRVRVKPNIAACFMDEEENRARPHWAEQFRADLEEYWQLLGRVSPNEIAPPPTLVCFANALRFHLLVESVEGLCAAARATYRTFVQRTQQKVQDEGYLDTALREIERERRNFSRSDHAQRAAALAEAVLEELGTDERFRLHRTALYNLLADIAYFNPLSEEPDNQRYLRVMRYLDEALRLTPTDVFALNFKVLVERLATTTLQIERFRHDTSTRIGNIRVWLDRLEQEIPPGSEAAKTVLALRRDVYGLTVMGKLVRRQEPSKEEDWKEVDPADLVRGLLKERGWPESCLQQVGVAGPWRLCPAWVEIALHNMIRNMVEAYGRSQRTLPPQPCRITVDYHARSITLRDWAGGVDPKLGDIFAPYVSSKGIKLNTGLGLTQARQALQLQSPRFSLELTNPQPPDGAEFRMLFPN
jgi:hypothetical protein